MDTDRDINMYSDMSKTYKNKKVKPLTSLVKTKLHEWFNFIVHVLSQALNLCIHMFLQLADLYWQTGMGVILDPPDDA